MDKDADYLREVREQYENFPYPNRDPDDEHKRLIKTGPDLLHRINHYCFSGKMDVHNNFRLLIAGGGTGDAVIFLAEQLKNTPAEIFYLDLSKASMSIAQQRAQRRNLTNINWVQGSILDVAQLNLGKFDYINCSGVLHHLESPKNGFNALRSVMKSDGAMAIMLYGKYGRTAVYQMQELMKQINTNEEDMQTRVDNTKSMLDTLPDSNWLNHCKKWFHEIHTRNDIDIYDMFLHSQDRAYSVNDLYDWLVDECKMHIHLFHHAHGYLAYDPFTYIRDNELKKKISALPVRTKEYIAELASGNMVKHNLYISNRPDMEAGIEDIDNVPFLALNLDKVERKELAEFIENNPGQSISIQTDIQGVSLNIKPGKYTSYMIRYMDGKNSLREIFNLIRSRKQFKLLDLTDDALVDEFRPVYNTLHQIDGILLRHKSIDSFRTPSQ